MSGFSTQHSWNYNITKIFPKCSWREFSSGINFYILILIMPYQKVFFCQVQNFCMKNRKTAQYNISKNVYFSFPACFVFLLLFNNTLHVMYYTYICYWNKYVKFKVHWHLNKVNKNVKNKSVSNWNDAQFSCLGFTSFNDPLCLLIKTTNNLLL